MSQNCYTRFHCPCVAPVCSHSAHYVRIQGFCEYSANVASAEYLAFFDDLAWLTAMSDLLFFCEKRIKDSDYYQTPKQEQATAPATSN